AHVSLHRIDAHRATPAGEDEAALAWVWMHQSAQNISCTHARQSRQEFWPPPPTPSQMPKALRTMQGAASSERRAARKLTNKQLTNKQLPNKQLTNKQLTNNAVRLISLGANNAT